MKKSRYFVVILLVVSLFLATLVLYGCGQTAAWERRQKHGGEVYVMDCPSVEEAVEQLNEERESEMTLDELEQEIEKTLDDFQTDQDYDDLQTEEDYDTTFTEDEPETGYEYVEGDCDGF